MCPHSGAQGHARAQQLEEFFWDGSPQRNTVNGVHLKWISAALTRSNRYALPDKTRKVQQALTNTTPSRWIPAIFKLLLHLQGTELQSRSASELAVAVQIRHCLTHAKRAFRPEHRPTASPTPLCIAGVGGYCP